MKAGTTRDYDTKLTLN